MKAPAVALLALLILGLAVAACTDDPHPGSDVVATFSIVARCPETGDLGVAVQSKFFGVGSVVPFARADVGAIATQAWANTRYGPDGLALLESGLAPEKVLEALTRNDPGRELRQVGIVDAKGRAASHTGREAMDWAGHVTGEGFACQGNILAGKGVVAAMAESFRAGAGSPLPERLVAALRAGQEAGGDKRGRQSAALLVVRRGGGYSGFNDRYVDVRVEDHETPIGELSRLLRLHRKFFPDVPLPADREGHEMEPAPASDAPPLGTPRAAWETWVARFRARDMKGLYATRTTAYRATTGLEEFAKEMEGKAEGIDRFLEHATYAGTKIDGDRATVAIRTPGAPRPILFRLEREEGEWRFAE